MKRPVSKRRPRIYPLGTNTKKVFVGSSNPEYNARFQKYLWELRTPTAFINF